MKIEDKIKKALESRYTIPEHVKACAIAIRYDLYRGPTWSVIPEGKIENFTIDHFATYKDDLKDLIDDKALVEETYIGKVGDTLREFIDNLPSELLFDADCEEFIDNEPEPFQDDDGEWIEPDWYLIYKLSKREIVAGLFGKFLATEFS
jgi:hypothetical protein